MENKGIQLIWIVVADIKATIKFYTETLGFTLQEYAENYGWAELKGKEGMLLGIAQENPSCDSKAGTNAVVTIAVDNIDISRQELLTKKVELVGEVMEVPGEVKMQTFRDQDGNLLQLCQLLK